MMKKLFYLVLALFTCFKLLPCLAGASLCGFIPATDSRIVYEGRWNQEDAKTMRTGKGASYLRVNFFGTCLAVKMDQDNSWWRVSIDGKEFKRFQPQGGKITLAKGLLPGKHEVVLIRDTEGDGSLSGVRGFKVFGTLQKPAPSETRRIEFIGDSVMAGAFAEGPGQYTEKESGALSFGPQLAKLLNADYSVIATSGEGVVRNMGEKASDNGRHAAQDYLDSISSSAINLNPHLIVLNHGANDFEAAEPPDAETFIKGYMDLVKLLREKNPQAVIICLDPVPEESGSVAAPLIETAVSRMSDAGLEDVYYLPLNHKKSLLAAEDFADGEHPLASGHTKLAMELKDPISSIMRWN